MSEFLPFALPDIGEPEIEEVCDSLRSGWLTTGPKAKKFESEFRDLVSAKHALAVNSATSGLHLGLEALGIGPGDKVVTTVNTFTASAEVIRYLGADPVFVDIDESTFNIDTSQVAAALHEDAAIAAVMPVHIAGQACDMDILCGLSREYDVGLIEDAAHALPTTFKGRMIGSFGDVTVFSFYVTKTLATGEGGMVVTNNDDIAKRISTMRLHGISRDVFDRYRSNNPSWYYEVIAPGFKYNMPDIAAAIGIHQLRRVRAMRNRRQEIADRYSDAFRGLPLETPSLSRVEDEHSWHLYIIKLDLDEWQINRNEFIEEMSRQGVGTSVHFIPLHMQPYWRDKYALQTEQFPIATQVYSRIVSLPIYSKMTDADVYRVIDTVRNVAEKNAR